MNDKVYIILLNYNSAQDTIECVNSIKENEKNLNYEIIVVDNKSSDNSVEVLEKCSGIELIKSLDNGGFAKGNNIAIDYVLKNGAEYVLLLNNDTTIEKDAISIMLNRLKEDDTLGIVGARIMYFDNKDMINYCGGEFNWLKATTIHKNCKEKFEDNDKAFEYTEFITGCCMLIKKEVFNKIGYLPEEYFMYYEDADFCVKAKEAGIKMGVCKDSVIYHKVSASSGGEESAFSLEWGTRNRILFIKKYKKYTKGLITKAYFYITRVIKICKYILKGEKNKAKAICIGIKKGRQYIKCNS